MFGMLLNPANSAHSTEPSGMVTRVSSFDSMTYVGKRTGYTPNLDRLAKESLFFENLYATGTRTVRGMEALTLNLPPTPGQAVIYRPEGTDLTTTFSPFLDRGYDCAFFYGGDGRFDYMNRYFSTAGCRIMDVNAWKPEDLTFKTAWGACDEDLFNKTISEADACHEADKPFHFFCMTTSNHRPFDFPAGRIDETPTGKRKPAVKYADWAIGNPLYFSSFLMGIGIGLLTSRMDFTLLLAAGYLAIFYPMMRNEAKLLKQTFPDFAEYEQNVPLFFPKFSLWNGRKNFEINFDRVKRTLIDSSLALLAIPAIILFHWIS
jgi:hypothetical protein